MAQSFQASQQQGGQMTTSRAPMPGATANSIPDLLKIGAIPSNTQISVETAILEPVTQSDTHCKFVLDNKGLLHSHSKIEFEFKCPTLLAGTPDYGQLPVNNGIHALIERATLKIGTKTVCEIEDYNFFATYKSSFLSPEAELEREQYLTGRNGNVLDINYTNRSINVGAAYQFGSEEQSNTSADGLMLGNGKEMEVSSSGTAFPYGAPVATTMNSAAGSLRPIVDCTALTRTAGAAAGDELQDLCPTFQIAISDLFPFLKTNQLPLYMMKEPVNFEFVFSKAGTAASNCDRVCGPAAALTLTAPILQSSTRMIADHLYYPQDMMEAYANANKTLQFQYVDYRLSKFSVTPADLASTNIRNIGGAGRIVSKVFWGINETETTGALGPNAQWIGGKYGALAPNRTYTNGGGAAGDVNGATSFNLKVNEQFLFPIDVTNNARHFHNVIQTEGSVPHLTREVFSKEGVSLTLARYGKEMMTGASANQVFGADFAAVGVGGQYPGTQFWNAMRLNRGERVNSRGIELYFKQDITTPAAPANHQFVQRVWLETLRTAVLQDGHFECYYA